MLEISRAQRPDWIWPRADSHVVLGADGAADLRKVFVEPGGSFSPGVGTYGVSLWIWLAESRQLVAPELLARDAIRDRLLGGTLPVYRSRWRAGPIEVDLRLAVEPIDDRYHAAVALTARLTHRGEGPCLAQLLLVTRPMGPAGGPIRQVAYDRDLRGLSVNGRPAVIGERTPDSAGCHAPDSDGTDLSMLLLRGRVPARGSATDAGGYASAALGYIIELNAGEGWETGWTLPICPRGPVPLPLVPARERLEQAADAWRQRLCRTTILCPDGRVSEAFSASVAHLAMAAVDGEPRIAPVCYPMLWVRDCVFILRALDLAGLHERARAGIEALRHQPWAGGFGPEADAPGQVLWLLHEHFRLTRDAAWLAAQAEFVAERVGWIERMRRADRPLRQRAGELLPRARLHGDHDLLCEAARDGLIIGRMDWHRPLWWVNAWSLAGLRAAAAMATALGESERAERWAAEAAELAMALEGLTPSFGQNERDLAGAIWPTGSREPADPDARDACEAWWRAARYDELGRYRPEPRWRYFELAQAHNMLLLGFRDEALLTVEHFLRSQDAPGLYAWAEGDETGNPSGDWRLVRGWWPTSKIVPHGWCSAEMALLLRDMMIYEEGDALVIGAGVRAEWLASRDDSLGIDGAPTSFGTASWRLEPAGSGRRWQLVIVCDPPPTGGYRLRLPLPASAVVEVDGAGIRVEDGDWPVTATGTMVQVTIDLP